MGSKTVKRLAEKFMSMMVSNGAAFALPVLFAISCAPPKSKTAYYEDLSPNRPKFVNSEVIGKTPEETKSAAHVVPSKNVNAKVDPVLDSINRINLTKRYVDGFTIQIYSGQKREDAMNVKQRMVSEAGDLSSTLQYIQPKFRVTVGSYVTRIEAQRDLVRLKRYFTAAILVPEKILLK